MKFLKPLVLTWYIIQCSTMGGEKDCGYTSDLAYCQSLVAAGTATGCQAVNQGEGGN